MALNIASPTLLQPVVALAGWTFVMESWMYATRIPAMQKYKVNMNPDKIGIDMQTKIPPHIRWKADNFNHLHEQPTVFYAVALALAVIGDEHAYTKYGAWAYVGLRVVHSLYQSLSNNPIMVRFLLFSSSSVVLAALTGRAAKLVF